MLKCSSEVRLTASSCLKAAELLNVKAKNLLVCFFLKETGFPFLPAGSEVLVSGGEDSEPCIDRFARDDDQNDHNGMASEFGLRYHTKSLKAAIVYHPLVLKQSQVRTGCFFLQPPRLDWQIGL